MSGKIFTCANCGRDILREPCKYCAYDSIFSEALAEICNPEDHPGDCACEKCDEEAHRQEVEDRIERTELIGGLER